MDRRLRAVSRGDAPQRATGGRDAQPRRPSAGVPPILRRGDLLLPGAASDRRGLSDPPDRPVPVRPVRRPGTRAHRLPDQPGRVRAGDGRAAGAQGAVRQRLGPVLLGPGPARRPPAAQLRSPLDPAAPVPGPGQVGHGPGPRRPARQGDRPGRVDRPGFPRPRQPGLPAAGQGRGPGDAGAIRRGDPIAPGIRSGPSPLAAPLRAGRLLVQAGRLLRDPGDGDRAIDALRRARSLDFFGSPGHTRRLEIDPSFDALRDRADFQSLLLDIAFPGDPFAPAPLDLASESPSPGVAPPSTVDLGTLSK